MSNHDIDTQREALIQQLYQGDLFDQDTIWQREITHEEFYYLLSRYPYLELRNADVQKPALSSEPACQKAKSGWIIYDYGDVICSGSANLSLAELHRLYHTLLGERVKPKHASAVKGAQDDDGDDGEGRRGTLQGQTLNTAYEMIQIAYSRWQNVAIVSGFYGMKRAAWVAAERFGKKLAGFKPTGEDRVVLHWANQLTPDMGMEFKPGKLTEPKP